MFEFRLRILEEGPNSFIGVVDEFPDFLVHGTSINEVEQDLVNVLIPQLRRLLNYEPVRYGLDELPTVRIVQLHLFPPLPLGLVRAQRLRPVRGRQRWFGQCASGGEPPRMANEIDRRPLQAS